MSYIYLLEQEEESSAECFADIPACALSKLNSIHEKSCCNASETECSHGSQYGTTCEPSTGATGKGKSMSSAVDSRAKTFQPLAKELASRATEAGCGRSLPELSARYDRATHSWKTPRCSGSVDLLWSSVTLPKWGMMQNGVCSALTTLAHPTAENACGYSVQTPRASDVSVRRETSAEASRLRGASPMLTEVIVENIVWPTPQVDDAKNSGKNQIRRETLASKVWKENQNVIYPTPRTTGMCGGSGAAAKTDSNPNLTEEEKRAMKSGNGGALSPVWVAWLMGWPIGHTDLKPLEMGRFRSWLQQHGIS